MDFVLVEVVDIDDVAVVIRLAVDKIIPEGSVAQGAVRHQAKKRRSGPAVCRTDYLLQVGATPPETNGFRTSTAGASNSRLEQVSPDSAFCSSEMSREVT